MRAFNYSEIKNQKWDSDNVDWVDEREKKP